MGITPWVKAISFHLKQQWLTWETIIKSSIDKQWANLNNQIPPTTITRSKLKLMTSCVENNDTQNPLTQVYLVLVVVLSTKQGSYSFGCQKSTKIFAALIWRLVSWCIFIFLFKNESVKSFPLKRRWVDQRYRIVLILFKCRPSF